jgi:hypothetical protein
MSTLRKCSVCGKPSLSECSACGTYYCGTVCQRADWFVHKFKCRVPVEGNAHGMPLFLSDDEDDEDEDEDEGEGEVEGEDERVDANDDTWGDVAILYGLYFHRDSTDVDLYNRAIKFNQHKRDGRLPKKYDTLSTTKNADLTLAQLKIDAAAAIERTRGPPVAVSVRQDIVALLDELRRQIMNLDFLRVRPSRVSFNAEKDARDILVRLPEMSEAVNAVLKKLEAQLPGMDDDTYARNIRAIRHYRELYREHARLRKMRNSNSLSDYFSDTIVYRFSGATLEELDKWGTNEPSFMKEVRQKMAALKSELGDIFYLAITPEYRIAIDMPPRGFINISHRS